MREVYLQDECDVNSSVFVYAYIESLNQPPDFGSFYGLFLFTMKFIGILIKKELERQERSISWFARKLSCDRSNVYRLFQKESIDTNLLARISILLGRDFFFDLSESIKEKMDSQNLQ